MFSVVHSQSSQPNQIERALMIELASGRTPEERRAALMAFK
jgi:hypothetical protein